MNRTEDFPVGAVGETLRQIVQRQPGIHFRALERAAGLSSAGHLRHHLDRLERSGLLVEVEDGHYKRFFVVGAHDARLRPELARFARPVPRLIGTVLLRGPLTRTALRRRLACADSTLGYHLRRMMLHGDLARTLGPNCCYYSLVDPTGVERVLAIHASGLHAPSAVRPPGPVARGPPPPLPPPPVPSPEPAVPAPPVSPPPSGAADFARDAPPGRLMGEPAPETLRVSSGTPAGAHESQDAAADGPGESRPAEPTSSREADEGAATPA